MRSFGHRVVEDLPGRETRSADEGGEEFGDGEEGHFCEGRQCGRRREEGDIPGQASRAADTTASFSVGLSEQVE